MSDDLGGLVCRLVRDTPLANGFGNDLDRGGRGLCQVTIVGVYPAYAVTPAVSGCGVSAAAGTRLRTGLELGCGATRACMGAGAGGFDEPCELARTLALGVVAHLLPDADLRLRECGHDTVAVSERDEPVAVAPQRQYRPVVVELAAVKRAGREP